jgi:hypothetical protein
MARGWAIETYRTSILLFLAVLPELVIVEIGAQVCDDVVGLVRSDARVCPRSRVLCQPWGM